MRFTGVELPDLADELRKIGFVYTKPNPPDGLEFQGTLYANGRHHPCLLIIPKSLDTIPTIWLTNMAADFSILRPHLSPTGYLCYIAHDSIQFDSFSPIGQTLACIRRAENVLDAILKGEMIEDLADEFHIHWPIETCLADVQPNSGKRELAYEVDYRDRNWLVLTDDKERTSVKIKWMMGISLDDAKRVLVARVKTIARPIPYQKDWPPKSVGQLLNWQSTLDKDCAQNINQALTAMTRVGARKTIFCIESPNLTYAFSTTIPQLVKRKKKPVPMRAELYRQKIVPFGVYRIDEDYMARRNLPAGKTLASLDILLVGCGTIGGYLAEMLVKAGAGTSGGRLVLVDKDSLGPQNIGRHRLGFDALFLSKVHALGKELARSSPGAIIQGTCEDIKKLDLGKFSLVIDATGEQALSDWITWKYTRQAAVLTVWVEGPGLAVRGLMKSQPIHACTRCISKPPQMADLQVFEQPTEILLRGQGCEGLYVPFSASASVQAAALAMEMVQSWVDKTDAPALRTRVLDTNRPLKTPDCSPRRTEGCPACST